MLMMFWKMGLESEIMTKWETWVTILIFSICWEPQTISKLLKMSLRKPKSSFKPRESMYLASQMSWLEEVTHLNLTIHIGSTTRIYKIFKIGRGNSSSIAPTRKLVAIWASKKLQARTQTPSCTGLTSTWTSSRPRTKRITIKFTSKTKTMCHHFTMMILKRERRSLNPWGFQIIKLSLDIKEMEAISPSARRSRCSSQSCKSCKCINNINSWAAQNNTKTGTATWVTRWIQKWAIIAAFSVMRAQEWWWFQTSTPELVAIADQTRATSISSCESIRHTARWPKMRWWSTQASNNTTPLQVTRGESPEIRAEADPEQSALALTTAIIIMDTTSRLRLELLEEAQWHTNRLILLSRRTQVAQARSLSSINSHSSLIKRTNRPLQGAHSETMEGCVTSRRLLRFPQVLAKQLAVVNSVHLTNK